MPVATQLKMADTGEDGVDIAFREDVIAGLSQSEKAIPARWFYDLRGSELFEEITQLPEYYPSRRETALLKEYGTDILRFAGPGRAVIEFGSGSSVKTPLLLREISPAAYVPIEISGDFLRQACDELTSYFPELPILPVQADFMRSSTLPPLVAGLARLGFFPGSTIGNMIPSTAVNLLRSMRTTLGAASQLLIGFDRVKETSRLLAAYDDAQGVTARFNLNLLNRINRELHADIPVASFRHLVRWNEAWSRIEMHLEAIASVDFSLGGKDFSMREGETIHTENSHKYTPRQAKLLLQAGGWSPVEMWSDKDEDFLLVLAEAIDTQIAP